MSSRIDIPVSPSHWVGLLAALPWLLLATFNLVLWQIYGGLFPVLCALALAGAVYQWNLNGRLCLARSVSGLVFAENGLWVQQCDGEEFPATVSVDSRLYPRLAILKLRPDDTKQRVRAVLLWSGAPEPGSSPGRGIWPGNVPAGPHRQLRARLRLGIGH